MTARDTIFRWNELPAATASLPGSGGVLRTQPKDFRVTEIPAYLPEGKGSHLYLYLRKRGLTTRDLVVALRDAGVPDARIGVAGLKDKHAVTEQWLSLPWALADRAAVLQELPGVEVLESSRHRNKLGIGHLHGNRFEILLRDVDDQAKARAEAVLAALSEVGVPNYYGPQRFGRFGRNVADGLRLLAGERVPGDRRLQRFFLSAVQSWLFNHMLAERLRDGLYRSVLPGDWARKTDTGGIFEVLDAAESARAERFEITALLPLHGRKVRISAGEPGRREQAALAELGLVWSDLTSRRGDRRASRILARETAVEEVADGLRVTFTLAKGAYATTVLREITKEPVDEPIDPAEAEAGGSGTFEAGTAGTAEIDDDVDESDAV